MNRRLLILPAAAAGMLAACETYESAPGRQRTDPRLKTTGAPAEKPDLERLEGREMVDHTVIPGDTLWELGRDYKVSIDDIKLANELENDVIRVGQTLKIPLPEGTKVSSPDELPAPGEPPADIGEEADAGTGSAPPPAPTAPADANPGFSPRGSAGGPPLAPGDQPTPPPPPTGGTGGT